MPSPPRLAKAKLVELWPGSDKQLKVQDKDGNASNAKQVTVQFNPQTLKVTFSNQKAGGDQRESSPVQFVGTSTTKLTLELWFDVLLPKADGSVDSKGDVRELTKEVAYFMAPQSVQVDNRKGSAPPGVRVLWGSFLFDGVMDSLDETLDLFSEDGRPLRASLAVSLSQQKFQFEFNPDFTRATGSAPAPGTQPLQTARAGDNVPQMASRAGVKDWKGVAQANGIENPRVLAPGRPIDLNVRTGPRR